MAFYAEEKINYLTCGTVLAIPWNCQIKEGTEKKRVQENEVVPTCTFKRESGQLERKNILKTWLLFLYSKTLSDEEQKGSPKQKPQGA